MIDQTAVAEVGTAPHRDAVRLARVAGALYLPMFVLGPFSLLYVRATLVVAFGAHLVIFGYLVWVSNLLHRAVGIALVVAGAGYVANSLLTLGWGPPSQPLLLLPAFPAELALCLWLLIKGVRPWPSMKEIS